MDTTATFKIIADGTAKVVTPGTAVQLAATSTPCRHVEVSAFQENAGVLVIGSSTALATAGSRRGRNLAPGETVIIPVNDVSLLYIDALTANDGISYVYYRTTS